MTPAVDVRRLNFEYPQGGHALREVSFQVALGECVALIGPNGAGKSTLLLHLNGVLPEKRGRDAGDIFIHGRKIMPQSAAEIRSRVGLVFQDADDQLFCHTVYEDIAFGPQQMGLRPEEVHRRVEDALARVQLTGKGFEKRSPHRLSGGEKRRVCLAGVLACEPDVLVLDEPTSGLDPRGRREFMALIRELDITRIVASHDLEMVTDLCTRAILLDGGNVVADGPTLELLGDTDLMLQHGLETPRSLLDPAYR